MNCFERCTVGQKNSSHGLEERLLSWRESKGSKDSPTWALVVFKQYNAVTAVFRLEKYTLFLLHIHV